MENPIESLTGVQEMEPLVSIIVPIYNAETTLRKSMANLCDQSYRKLEILLVDDGSTDSSGSICDDLAEKDQRIHVIHTTNQGSGPARNVGIGLANGKYLYFPDADDKLENNAIEVLVDTAEKFECDLVVFGFRTVGSRRNKLLVRKYEPSYQNGDSIRASYSNYYGKDGKMIIQGAPWNKFFCADLVSRYSVRFPSLRRHQDEAFIARYMCHVKSVVFIPEVLYTYYANDLRKEWNKYPADYYKIAEALYEDRKDTILRWKEDDRETHNLVILEYIYNYIKGMELSFGPKYKFNHANRKKWIRDRIQQSELTHIRPPDSIHRYQGLLISLFQRGCWNCAYFLMWMKTRVEYLLK